MRGGAGHDRTAPAAAAAVTRGVHAAENRARHGQTRHQKTLRKAEDAQAARRLDGHRLTAPGDADGAHKPDA